MSGQGQFPVAPPRQTLRRAADLVPPGRWGVAVSGGADSVATLLLLHRRMRLAGDLELVVVHLDHELRGQASREDAAFVEELARRCGVAVVSRRRGDLEGAAGPMAGNLSEHLRRLRLAVYREAVEAHRLAGVILGHHADDVAETLLLRLLRGSPRSGTLGLVPLRVEQTVAGVCLLRPVLGVRRARLRALLERTGQPWREDASNATDSTARNRVRRLLAGVPGATEALLRLAASAQLAEERLEAATPALPHSPVIAELVALPEPIRRRALRRWLRRHGVPEASAGPRQVDLVVTLLDTAGPRTVTLPGGVRFSRSRGRLARADAPAATSEDSASGPP